MNKFEERHISEIKQFFFLCGDKDRSILISRKKKDKINELARLACISLVFDYRSMFIRIFADTEKYCDEFVNRLNQINGNFAKLEEWMENFIDNIGVDETKQIALELWTARKKTLYREDLQVKHLLVF